MSFDGCCQSVPHNGAPNAAATPLPRPEVTAASVMAPAAAIVQHVAKVHGREWQPSKCLGREGQPPPAATVSSLEADLHDGADWWAGTKRVRVEGDAAGESR